MILPPTDFLCLQTDHECDHRFFRIFHHLILVPLSFSVDTCFLGFYQVKKRFKQKKTQQDLESSKFFKFSSNKKK